MDEAKRAQRFRSPESLTSIEKTAFMGKATYLLGKSMCQKVFGNNSKLTSQVQRQLKFKLLRNIFFKDVSLAQLGLIFKPTLVAYQGYCKKNKLQPNIAYSENDTRTLWLGKDSPEDPAAKVMVYLHGGGYGIAGGHDDHWKFIESVIEASAKKGIKCSSAVLAYDLSYHKPYPQQLTQAATMLDYLFKQGWKPSQIVLMGESAGGNLIFSLLLHILKPCPYVPVQITLPDNEPLSMAISMSPWTDLALRLPCAREGFKADPKNADYLNPLIIDTFTMAYTATLEPGMDLRWTNLADTPIEWWNGLGNVCSEILITGGTEEVFAPDIEKFASVLGEAQQAQKQQDGTHPKVAIVELMMEKGVHAEPAIAMGVKKEDVVLWMRLLDWFSARL